MIYEPREDSFLLEKAVRRFSKKRKVLEIGCGSGTQLEAARASGALEVLGVDSDAESVEFCREKGLNVIESNLFKNVEGKFNLIIFNPPYLPSDEREDYESSLATSGGKKGDEIILRFLKEVGNYLDDDGIILLVVSSLTPIERIEKILSEQNFEKEVVVSENFFMEKLFVDVGAGILVRKTPGETKEIIDGQIKKFNDARIRLKMELESFAGQFGEMMREVEKLKKTKKF